MLSTDAIHGLIADAFQAHDLAAANADALLQPASACDCDAACDCPTDPANPAAAAAYAQLAMAAAAKAQALAALLNHHAA